MSEEKNKPLNDEFFVGYLPRTPAGVARRVRVVVGGMCLVAVAMAGLSAAAFRAPPPASWSDTVTEFTGQLIEKPYPMLRMSAGDGVQRYLLVSPGKHGAAAAVAGFDGAAVHIRGTALERDGRRMIELADEASPITRVNESSPSTRPSQNRGHQTLAGEIIDPKCFFGAMKPGDGKLHKACAIRCIDGGIPPMLAAGDPSNPGKIVSYYLLVASNHGPINSRVLPFVAEPVEVSGSVEEADGMLMLIVDDDPAAIRRK